MKLSVILKIVLVILALITMAVGLYAHFDSKWTESHTNPRGGVSHPYDACDDKDRKSDKDCPHISLEQFFVAMAIICFIWAIVSLVLSFFLDGNNIFQLVDLILHVICGILLLIGSITFLVSAIQIDDFFLDRPNDDAPEAVKKEYQRQLDKFREDYLFGAKIAAAILGIIQAILHIVVGVFSFQGQ